MPKNSKDFPVTLNFSSTLEMKQQLVAVGYFMGSGGEYSSAARNFLSKAYRAWLGTLTDKERREFDEILARCQIIVSEAVREPNPPSHFDT